MELVIVLDRTASLQQADPNKLSQEAAKLIVDLMVPNGSKMGFVQYTDKVIERRDMTTLNAQEKNKLNQAQASFWQNLSQSHQYDHG